MLTIRKVLRGQTIRSLVAGGATQPVIAVVGNPEVTPAVERGDALDLVVGKEPAGGIDAPDELGDVQVHRARYGRDTRVLQRRSGVGLVGLTGEPLDALATHEQAAFACVIRTALNVAILRDIRGTGNIYLVQFFVRIRTQVAVALIHEEFVIRQRGDFADVGRG